jgi:hypothetical protein
MPTSYFVQQSSICLDTLANWITGYPSHKEVRFKEPELADLNSMVAHGERAIF